MADYIIYLFNTSNNITTICLHIITYATLLMHIITLNNAVSSLLMGHVFSKQTYYKKLLLLVDTPALERVPTLSRPAASLRSPPPFIDEIRFEQPPYLAFSRFK